MDIKLFYSTSFLFRLVCICFSKITLTTRTDEPEPVDSASGPIRFYKHQGIDSIIPQRRAPAVHSGKAREGVVLLEEKKMEEKKEETKLKEKTAGVKYIVEAKFFVDGVVEKHDVIGAIFGQTEGLLPPEFDLRELLKSGKIGRINIYLTSEKDRTEGKIELPSSLDRPETAIIAAAMESVDRVGPCEAKIDIEQIRDVRMDKRKQIVDRARELLKDWVVREVQDAEKIVEEVSKAEKQKQAVKYGAEKLTSTSDINELNSIILVEGRADVINLTKSGYTGIIALEGVKVPKTIITLSKKKEITAFLDGDRGGDLILKELLQVADIKYVARAPRGKEVEELDVEEIKTALENKVPIGEVAVLEETKDLASQLRGTLEGVLMNKDGKELSRVPVSQLVDTLKNTEGIHLVAFDGIITGRLLDLAKEKGIKYIIGERLADSVEVPKEITVKTFSDFGETAEKEPSEKKTP
jgi:5S rRNA maturation endonuclease (ribonuclease M5)